MVGKYAWELKPSKSRQSKKTEMNGILENVNKSLLVPVFYSLKISEANKITKYLKQK